MSSSMRAAPMLARSGGARRMMQAVEAARVRRDIGRTAYAVKPDLAAAGSGDVRWQVAAALLDAQLLVGDHAIGPFRLVPAPEHALCGACTDRLLRRQQQPHLPGLVGRQGPRARAVPPTPQKNH